MKTRFWIGLFTVALVVLAAVWFGTPGRRRSRADGPAADRRINPELVDGDKAFREARDFIDLGPRHSGTPGAEKAAAHIAARLRDLGLHPSIDEFRDPTPSGESVFRNVIGAIPGAGDKIVVLVSHYDTKSGISKAFAGANDSGSSTGLLLELARVLRRSEPLPCNVVLAFLDGEECVKAYGENDGLHGSRRLARQMRVDGRSKEVLAVLVLDMVGDRDLTITLPRNGSPVLTSLIFEAAKEEGVRGKFSLGEGPMLDDHVPFMAAGMPAVDIIDYQYGSVPGKNDFWHSLEDTIDKLSPESLETVGRVTVRTINRLVETTAPLKRLDKPLESDPARVEVKEGKPPARR